MNALERGDRAAKLLGDPVLSDAFAAVDKAIHDKWAATPLRDKDAAHELRLMLKLLRDVRANLEAAVNDGKVEALRIEQEKTRRFHFFR